MTTRVARTKKMLSTGWITPLDCAMRGGVLSLSQRVGDFRRDGMTIIDKWVVTPGGARVKAYRLIKPTRWTA